MKVFSFVRILPNGLLMSKELKTADVPQANDLTKVIQTLVGVSVGKSSDKAIAKVIGYTDRQARYYRKALEILGLATNDHNNCLLTDSGHDFLNAMKSNPNHLELLKPYIFEIPLIRELFDHFSTENIDYSDLSSEEILKALFEISDLDPKETTAKRRLSTIINWLEQTNLLTKSNEDGATKFVFVPYVPNNAKPSKQVINQYESFKETLLPFLAVQSDESENTGELESALEKILSILDTEELSKLITSNESADNIARLIISISEKSEIGLENLVDEIAELKKVEVSAERILLERDRCLKGASSSISSGGTYLEQMIKSWFEHHDIKYEPHYLFDGLSKNCDFYAEDLNVAIESKYSKTSGTKHSGAIKDLNEISKAKATNKNLTFGLAVGGTALVNDPTFWKEIETLHKNKVIDFILTPYDIETTSPTQLGRKEFPEKIDPEHLKIADADTASTWNLTPTNDEFGLLDSAYWLRQYSKVSFLNFESLLQSWISQTPFAIQCLRLILSWSESQMESFVKASVPQAVREWKTELWNFSSVSLLVRGLSKSLSEDDKELVLQFFNENYTVLDLVLCRELGLTKWARKKKDTSSTFISKCVEHSPYEVLDDKNNSLDLPNGGKAKSAFIVKDKDGKTKNVLCHFYSTSGSVMSDLVKKIEGICQTDKKDEWVLITDGSGWLSRDKDLRRLFEIARLSKFEIHNLESWQGKTTVLKRHIP